jgi:hypothetical protein
MRVGAACDRCSTAQAETLAAMKTMHGMQLQLERQVLTRDTTIANMKSDRVLELAELRTSHARELQEREGEAGAPARGGGASGGASGSASRGASRASKFDRRTLAIATQCDATHARRDSRE